MKFALRYQTEYRYSGQVFDQHNSLRVTPAEGPLQRVRRLSRECGAERAHARTATTSGPR